MNNEIINEITERMERLLNQEQLNELQKILFDIQNRKAITNISGKSLVKKFISAKRIEGCSRRTETYYNSVLIFFEKNINCDICRVNTEKIREYLINYQKINNCSNVTLDTIRRILSTFYKWLEEENYILKSPMKRIHRIKMASSKI